VLVSDLTRIVVPTLVCVILIVPLGAAIVSVWRKGGYVSQAYLWRSAPAGVDPGTLVLGNPRGALWPGGVASTYQRRHIEAIERVAWLGPGRRALCGAAFRARDRRVRLLTAVARAFPLRALGPPLATLGNDVH